MSIYETVVPGSAAGYTGLVFRIPAEAPVKTLRTADLDLVPTGPLFVEPNEEAVRTLIAAPWHGAIEYSPLKDRVFKNAEGSWEFYYVLDEKAHSCWDCYIDPPINREDRGYAVTERTWTSTYHTLLHFLQGKRVLVDVPDGKGSIKTYKGRCWVSGYTTDESGQIKATITPKAKWTTSFLTWQRRHGTASAASRLLLRRLTIPMTTGIIRKQRSMRSLREWRRADITTTTGTTPRARWMQS